MKHRDFFVAVKSFKHAFHFVPEINYRCIHVLLDYTE